MVAAPLTACPYRRHAERVLSDGRQHTADTVAWAMDLLGLNESADDALQRTGDLTALAPAERIAIVRPFALRGAA